MSALAIRRLVADDIAAAAAILDAAFRPSDWHVGLRRGLLLQPDGLLIAERAGRPLGLVGAVDYGPLAYVGMLGVRPEAQRQGVALALMEALLAWLDGRGCPLAALDATDMGAPLYARLGFVDVGRSYMAAADSAPAAGPLPEGVFRLGPGDLAELAAFEAPIFGAGRRALLADLIASHPGRALAARDGAGGLIGYIVARDDALGPWAARTPQAADLLLRAGLACGFATPPRVLIPAGSAAAAGILAAAGFSVRRELRYMQRGGPTLPGRPSDRYGLASFALG